MSKLQIFMTSVAFAASTVSAVACAEPAAGMQKKFLGDPIVFVHGCPVPEPLGSGTNYVTSTYWWKMYEQFRAKGYPAAPWPDQNEDGTIDSQDRLIPGSDPVERTPTEPAPDQYLNVLVQSKENGECGSLRLHADELATYIDDVLAATGARKVDIVANSLGGLAARWYLKQHGTGKVRDFVLLAATNHGTNVALVTEPGSPPFASPNYDGAREATPAYNCDPMHDSFQRELNGCEGVDEIEATVAGTSPEDEAKVSWLNLYNDVFDELHQPTETSCLNQRFPNDCSDPVNRPLQNLDGEPHGDYRLNQAVIDATYAHVSSRKDKAGGP